MTALVCELCGGKLVGKAGGVFVCDSCGMEYDKAWAQEKIQEIKGSVRIEGTVDVSGSTIKVDRSNEIDNILKNADTTYADGNYKEAFELYSKVLNILPDNPHAIIYRALSSAWQSSVRDCRIGEINKASERAYKLQHEISGDTKEYFDFCTESATKIAVLINSVAKMYISYFNKANPRASLSITVNMATAGIAAEVKKTLETGTKNCCIVSSNVVTFMLANVSNYLEATDGFYAVAKNMAKNCAIYRKNANMSPDSSDKVILALVEAAEEKTKKAASEEKERIKKEKADAYWAEHPEEKEHLESEIKSLQEKVDELNKKISSVKENPKKDELEKEMRKLQYEKSSLGVFKTKEKKEIQGKIDDLNKQLTEINSEIQSEVDAFNAEIKARNKKIDALKYELTKER